MRRNNVSLADYTYMKVGGPADVLVEVDSVQALIDEVRVARQENTPYFVIGGGSNLLFTDKGFRGLIIVNRANHITVDPIQCRLTAESGAPTNLVVNQANTAGLAGLETLMGVPGSIGGAIYNNAHFLDKFIGDYVGQVTVLDSLGVEKIIPKRSLEFGYDTSVFQHSKDIILRIEFELAIGDPKVLANISTASVSKRRQSQPLELPSSGCMFKNLPKPTPSGITAAGALIDQVGLKGVQIGGAQVSPKHANFIVNTGGATTQDIIDLSNKVIDAVKAQSGVTLEREVFIINEHGERMGNECL